MEARDGTWAAPRRPTRTGVTRTSQYVPTKDGTKIAIDLFVPADLRAGEQVPTLIMQTPYMRAVDLRVKALNKFAGRLAFLGNVDFAEACVAFGYAFILMDLRGSGASYGQRSDKPFRDAAADGSDIIDWVVAQPWSNGRVGANGVSAHGLCAMWLTTARNPALRAIAPRFTSFDNFNSTHPGGATATRFMRDIRGLVDAMDHNELWKMPDNVLAKWAMRALVRGIRPVDADRDGSQLAAAVRDHAGNVNPADQMVSATTRDTEMAGAHGSTIDEQSVFSIAGEVRDAQVPIYVEAGWFDAAFARELIALHNTVSVAIPGSRLTIGPWGHGGKFFSSPTASKKTPTAFDHAAELARFFDVHLRPDVVAGDEDPIHYFTMGEDKWKSCKTWPVPSVATPYYLSAGRLALEPPASGSESYSVDFGVGTGVHSRYGKHLTTELYPVTYPDRVAQDARLLCYDSAPLLVDTEVTGHPLVHLVMSSTATDALVIVYVEDVAPSGAVSTVADGWLQARDRAVTSAEAPYWMAGPYRTFTAAAAAPLEPGVPVDLDFELYPTSWLFRAGHRIRVAVAGADKDNLQEVARDQNPVITVRAGSYVSLPMVAR